VAAVLVKGGHLRPSGDAAVEITDLLVTPERTYRFTHPRLPGPSPRGTGCALATAIAVELAAGADLPTAIETATSWLTSAIARATPVDNDLILPFA
jgi:hydroxymethylpyrimidine/phosphomethylpyrimidine kinase